MAWKQPTTYRPCLPSSIQRVVSPKQQSSNAKISFKWRPSLRLNLSGLSANMFACLSSNSIMPTSPKFPRDMCHGNDLRKLVTWQGEVADMDCVMGKFRAFKLSWQVEMVWTMTVTSPQQACLSIRNGEISDDRDKKTRGLGEISDDRDTGIGGNQRRSWQEDTGIGGNQRRRGQIALAFISVYFMAPYKLSYHYYYYFLDPQYSIPEKVLNKTGMTTIIIIIIKSSGTSCLWTSVRSIVSSFDVTGKSA